MKVILLLSEFKADHFFMHVFKQANPYEAISRQDKQDETVHAAPLKVKFAQASLSMLGLFVKYGD